MQSVLEVFVRIKTKEIQDDNQLEVLLDMFAYLEQAGIAYSPAIGLHAK